MATAGNRNEVILVITRTAGLLGPHLGSAIPRNLHTGTARRDLRVPEVGKPPDRIGTVFPAQRIKS